MVLRETSRAPSRFCGEHIGASMASMVCLSHPLPVSHLLYPSPSTHDRRFLCCLRRRRCCKLAFKHGSPSSASRRRGLGFSLDMPQAPRLRIVASLAVNNTNPAANNTNPPMYHSPLLQRLAENSGQVERKVYADEYELNYDVYASNSMADWVPPPPPPIPFGGPWEEYYDELIGEDYVPKQEKPTSSLIKYLEELNQKMADDDAKAGKPPRKMFPNRELDLSFDEGPRFLKPRGQVSRYYPSPPVMAPLTWVLEGGATPYIEPPPPPPPPVKASAETPEAPTTSPASDTPTAAPLSAQGTETGTGPGVGVSSTTTASASAAPTSASSFGQGSTSTYQRATGAQSRPVQSQPYEPILLRNRVPPANQNSPEPYQPILLRNRVPPVSPGNQNNPVQQSQSYQPVTTQGPPTAPVTQSSPGSSSEPYQPILLKNRVPPVSPANQNSPVQQSQPWPSVPPTNQNSPVQQSQPWSPVPSTNQNSPVQQSQPWSPVPPTNQNSPVQQSQLYQPNSGMPPASLANQNRPGQESQPYWAPSVPSTNQSSPVQENRNSPVMQSIHGQESHPPPPSAFRNMVPPGGPANPSVMPAQGNTEQRPVFNQSNSIGTSIDSKTSFDTNRSPQSVPVQGGRESTIQYTPQSGPTRDTSGWPSYPQARPMPVEQAQDTSRPLFPQTRPFEQQRDSGSASPSQQPLEQTVDHSKQFLPQTRPFSENSDSSRHLSQVRPFEGASDSIGTFSPEKSGQWSSPQSKDTGDMPSRFYEPKEGDVIVGAVISGDDWKLDLEIGAEQPAVMAFRDFQSFPLVDLDGSFFSLRSSDDVLEGFVPPIGRSLVVRGNDDGAFSSEYVENGAVLVAEVQGRTYAQDGPAILSCRSLARRFTWNRIKQLMQMGQPIELEILQFNDGGLSGYFEGLRAFLPRSELVQRPESTASLEGYVGRVIRVAIVQADEDASNIIISELKYWMQSNLQVGTVHDVTVTRIYPYGIQAEIKDTRIRGFVHISNMSKEYVRSVTDLFQEGDTARVMLIKGRNPQQVSFSIADLESEAGLIFRDKTRVYQEAEDMASKIRESLSAEERQIFALQGVAGIENLEVQSLSIANMEWLHLGIDNKAASAVQ